MKKYLAAISLGVLIVIAAAALADIKVTSCAAAGGGSLAYVKQVMTWAQTNSNASNVITVTSSVAAGDTVAVAFATSSATVTLSSVASDCGGSDAWTVLSHTNGGVTGFTGWALSKCANGLASGTGTITLTWNEATYAGKTAAFLEFSGTATPPTQDGTLQAQDTFGQVPTLTITTSQQDIVLASEVAAYGRTWTFGGGFNSVGSISDTASNLTMFYGYRIAAAGTYNPSGTWDATTSFTDILAALN